jgi:hypothetical protein
MRLRIAVILAVTAMVMGSGANADLGKLIGSLHLGPDVGAYFPTSPTAAARFGNTWFGFGVGLGRLEQVRQHAIARPSYDMFFQIRGSSHAFFVPLGVSYKAGFLKSGRLEPYAGVTANYVLTDLRSDQDHIQSRFRSAWGSSFFVGTEYSRHGFVEVRYYAITRVRTLDLSGFDLKAGYRF